MKAGRELDALVAEKVMGLTSLVATGTFLGKGLRPFVINPNLPRYSADIAAAWEVVEKFAFFTLEWDGLNHRAVVHALQMKTDTRPPASAIEDTAPLAICLAALKAVGALP